MPPEPPVPDAPDVDPVPATEPLPAVEPLAGEPLLPVGVPPVAGVPVFAAVAPLPPDGVPVVAELLPEPFAPLWLVPCEPVELLAHPKHQRIPARPTQEAPVDFIRYPLPLRVPKSKRKRRHVCASAVTL